jgi:integrase
MNTSDDLRGDALALAKKLKVVSAGTTFKTAWKKLITAANLPGLRPYDMRHTGITNLLQLPEVSLETCKAIAGHISAEIVKTYSHIGMTARREALDALMRAATKRPPRREANRDKTHVGPAGTAIR